MRNFVILKTIFLKIQNNSNSHWRHYRIKQHFTLVQVCKMKELKDIFFSLRIYKYWLHVKIISTRNIYINLRLYCLYTTVLFRGFTNIYFIFCNYQLKKLIIFSFMHINWILSVCLYKYSFRIYRPYISVDNHQHVHLSLHYSQKIRRCSIIQRLDRRTIPVIMLGWWHQPH